MRSCPEKFLLALGLGSLLASSPAISAAERSPASGTPASGLGALLRLDPRLEANLDGLARGAEALSETAEEQARQRKAARKEVRDHTGLSNLSPAALRGYFHEPPDQLSRREVRGLAELTRLAHAALKSQSPPEREAFIANLLEVMAALRNDRRSPVPEKLGFTFPFRLLLSDCRRTVGRGATLANNLEPERRPPARPVDEFAKPIAPGPEAGAPLQATSADPSRLDPAPSSFWQRPPDIARHDLYAGFGRERLPNFTDVVWRYDGPKTSFGTKGGFDVEGDGQRFQIKFGEVNSEPFTARIFHALGYHVDPTDYWPRLRIRYDRRLFREFHLRKPLTMYIRPFGIPQGSVELQPRYDPFNFVVTAVFKDGRQVSGSKLKQMLLIDLERDHPENSPGNFRADIEASLDYLIMSPANVQPKDESAENIGPWEFGGLGHERRRELRGAALLAAWLEWSDSRSDNTRLRVSRTNGDAELLHFFSDLGSGMGGASGRFSQHGEKPNQFDWTFTQAEIVRGPGQMTTPFRVVHFRPIVTTPAFHEMTEDDARWMARLIGQLTEKQMRAALVASGYDAAEVKLYQEKLVSRRDQMVRDLKLADEIPLLRTNTPDCQFSYDPPVDGPMNVVLPSGETVCARPSRQTVQRGRLVKHKP